MKKATTIEITALLFQIARSKQHHTLKGLLEEVKELWPEVTGSQWRAAAVELAHIYHNNGDPIYRVPKKLKKSDVDVFEEVFGKEEELPSTSM